MSPCHLPDSARSSGFPRVSGDEPALGMQGEQIQQFSPRERG